MYDCTMVKKRTVETMPSSSKSGSKYGHSLPLDPFWMVGGLPDQKLRELVDQLYRFLGLKKKAR